MQVERIGAIRTRLGECPVWDAARSRLWMVDCRSGELLCVDPDSGAEQRWQLPAPVGSFALNGEHECILALKESFALYCPSNNTLRTLAWIDDRHRHLRLNDGTPLPDGSFVAGTMHIHRQPGEAPLGGLYRLDGQGRLARIAAGLGVVNGPTMHPTQPYFYVCDSSERKIYRYAVNAKGELGAREVFVDTAGLGSAPDGCCFDNGGGLWTALVHAGAIVRFAADGSLDLRVDLPVKHPASLCFGGDNLSDVFVTTISDSERLSATGPLDGALLRVRGLGFTGAPLPRCSIRV
ncbi:SMP-30/gluconolactonase/LRE family protein [Alcaligenaceae bacterium A4P071]|nr:SMP-30/gluconolactonase/LRE family protein [Alcaligenaceae bacterium A4P071]